MTSPPLLSHVVFQPAPLRLRPSGLIGFVSCILGDSLRLDGITLRRTAAGTLVLSFPQRRDGTGSQHPYFAPVDREARAAIEAQVFASLSRQGVVP